MRNALAAGTWVLGMILPACAEPASSGRPVDVRPAWVAVDEGWTRLPDPPEVRPGAAYVWAETRLLAWGGCSPALESGCRRTADGFAYDPVAETWRELPEAPLKGAYGGAVWTGREAIFFDLGAGHELDGVAFDPASRSWRQIQRAPIAARAGAVHVWTGIELIVWGGGEPGDASTTSGAAYNPASDAWRRLADAPRGLNAASGMWTGTKVLVFGSLLDGRNVADTNSSLGLAYDPATDSWVELARSQLSPQATSANWVNNRMVAWDYEVHWQEYDLVADRWSHPQQMPLEFSECYPDSVIAGDQLFAFFCGSAAVYDADLARWELVSGGPLNDTIQGHEAAYKLWRFASLVPAGDVVFMPMQGLTVDEEGVPCYGCPGSPHSFWSYRITAET